MVVSKDGILYGWGLNLKGQLGTGDFENRVEAVKIELD
jgi:alpha-tubulin suppressor-like RCC1 family protein